MAREYRFFGGHYHDTWQKVPEGVKLGFARVRIEKHWAIMFDTKEHGTLWVPQSAIHYDSETWNMAHPAGELVVTAWFAEKNGLL